jgi:uncharacterized metal-binding protein
MSSGRTHDRITLWTLPLVVLVAFRVTLNGWLTAILCFGYLFGGWMFGPDLDIHSVQYKRWGWFRWIWLPYRGRIRHRSHLSHGPFIGTALRVLYFSGWVALGGLILVDLLNSSERAALTWGDLFRGIGWGIQTYWPFWLALLVGLELGACSHYVTDWLTSKPKKEKQGKKVAKAKRLSSRKSKSRPRSRS